MFAWRRQPSGKGMNGWPYPFRHLRHGYPCKGIPSQPTAFVRPDIVLFGKKFVPVGGYFGPLQYHYHPDLYRREWSCPRPADGAAGANLNNIIFLCCYLGNTHQVYISVLYKKPGFLQSFSQFRHKESGERLSVFISSVFCACY